MGGIGSGRSWGYGSRDSTDDYRSIDVRRWKRDGLLNPHQSFQWRWLRNDEVVGSINVRTEQCRVMLSYRQRSWGDEWQDEQYPVNLEWTDCHLGGKRPWFLCPARGCWRRVAILYGGRIFACRRCYDLSYPSQRESWGDRAARRADRIREKLDWEPGILNGEGDKPKGMHWSTFNRLTAQHEFLVQSSMGELAKSLNRFGGSIDDYF